MQLNKQNCKECYVLVLIAKTFQLCKKCYFKCVLLVSRIGNLLISLWCGSQVFHFKYKTVVSSHNPYRVRCLFWIIFYQSLPICFTAPDFYISDENKTIWSCSHQYDIRGYFLEIFDSIIYSSVGKKSKCSKNKYQIIKCNKCNAWLWHKLIL